MTKLLFFIYVLIFPGILEAPQRSVKTNSFYFSSLHHETSPPFLTAPFKNLISSQQDAVLTIVKSILCRIVTKFIKNAHKHRWCLAFCLLWLEMKLTVLSSEKNSQKLVTVALHLCTCSFLPAKFTRRPPILFPVSTQGAPSELYVVVSDKWIKGL